ncbi:response regulator transcription factor [Saccharopolyspora sp. HNM0983]|uniref:Response regulator transcription factor n=1 Tax=Saccharopolyspora montiporae TaxID=2781240 RepID=A0A929FZK4_9PSEU|nr:response regulator transcription factor [Saccharopolyspora sp. HNM0983]MBE9373837.1 response regulator transcription factor [Saccharopolyspora sp. HNM0983]
MDARRSPVGELAAACSRTAPPSVRAHGILRQLHRAAPYAAAMISYVDPADGGHRALAASGYSARVADYLLTDFIHRDPGYAAARTHPDRVMCWRMLPGYTRTVSVTEFFRPSGFGEGSSLCLRDGSGHQVGALHISVRQGTFPDSWLGFLAELRAVFAELSAAAGVRSAAPLTPRETDVLRLLAAGMSNAQIAADLVLSRRTVGTHVEHILRKLGAANRVQVTARAVALGLAEPW